MEWTTPGKDSQAGTMIRLISLLALVSMALASKAEDWQSALARMPLNTTAAELNRTNCVGLMLNAFQDNPTVKALVFMPGATDEFYMFRRARAQLTAPNPSLLDAIVALTNQSLIRATFQSPFLLLHTDEDPLDVVMNIEHEPTAKKLQTARFARHIVCDDRDWNYIQPILKKTFRMDVRPWRHSYDSWHFYRHSFAAWNVGGVEALKAIALAGKTCFTVQKRHLVFEGDERVRATPKLENFPK
jgi:hypothetical protein